MKIDKGIDLALAFVGIGSAVGVAVAKQFSGGDKWELPLLAFCTASLAVMLTKQQYQCKEYQQKIECALSSLTSDLSGAHTLAEKLIYKLLQSFTFNGSPIDDGFSVRYGHHLLDQARDNPSKTIEEVLRVKRTNKIFSRERKYEIMRMLFEEVAAYRGIAYYEELKDGDSEDFIFATPVSFGRAKHIERLFLVPDLTSLKQLPADKRQKLRDQISGGVSLRWLQIQRQFWPENFGIYGEIAVGILDGKTNVIDFSNIAVRSRRSTWDTYWGDAKELKVADLS